MCGILLRDELYNRTGNLPLLLSALGIKGTALAQKLQDILI